MIEARDLRLSVSISMLLWVARSRRPWHSPREHRPRSQMRKMTWSCSQIFFLQGVKRLLLQGVKGLLV